MMSLVNVKRVAAVLVVLAAFLVVPEARAADVTGCVRGLADAAPPAHFMRVAAWQRNVPADKLKVTYIGHSSFLLETPGGASIVTDFNGAHQAPYIPDIVTMNGSHDSHYTDFVPPEVTHVLRGWEPEGGVAHRELKFKDVEIYNLPTNFDRPFGDASNVNSIFVFKAAHLCVAHLSHLGHLLSRDQRRRIRRIDVLFLNIDGNYLSHPEAFQLIEQIGPRVVIPMHYHFGGAVAEFNARAAENDYPVREAAGSTVLFSDTTLPRSTEILYLQPQDY